MFILRILLVSYFKIAEEILRLIFRSFERSSYRALSPEERVWALEERRRAMGYKPGWLYYRCQEEGLSEILEQLRTQSQVRSDA